MSHALCFQMSQNRRAAPRCHVLNAPCSQVSEDHCWLNCDPGAGREGTIEVTTDSAAKRALPVDAAAWQGWLYSGGHAPLCSHQVFELPMIGYPEISNRKHSLSSVGPLTA